MTKFLQSVLINRVEIGHENQRNEGFFTQFFSGIQTDGHGNAVFQGFKAGTLNGGAVRHRVRKGDAEFHNVAAALRQQRHNFQGGGDIGVTHGDISN